MEAFIRYLHCYPYSAGSVLIRQLTNNDIIDSLALQFQNLSINGDTHKLPTLAIKFHLYTIESYYYTPSAHEPVLFQGDQTHDKILNLNLDPSEYMSYDMFYSVMLAHLLEDEWGEEFDGSYRDLVLRDMIVKVREFVDHESNKGCQKLEVLVGVTVVVPHLLDERILFEESSFLFQELPSASLYFNRMVPASKSSMQLLKRMEVDASMMNEDCVICLEELGQEQRELLCMPCSHIFHGNCITNWLKSGHCCPICRYQMPTK